jgi:hypothetical protein
LDSVKLIDEKLAEKGLLKLIQTLSEELKVPGIKAIRKERPQIITRKTRNLRSTKAKDMTKSIEVKESGSSAKEDKNMHVTKDQKITAHEQQQNKPSIETRNPIEDQGVERLESRVVQEMPVKSEVRSRKNNLLHGVIAKLIKSKKVKLKFTYRKRITMYLLIIN